VSILIPESVEKPFQVIGSSSLWKRVGVVALGSALVIIGLVLMVSGSQAIKDAASLAVGVASKGIVK
jgi:hypothetical protein